MVNKSYSNELNYTVDIFDERSKAFLLKKGDVSERGLRTLLRNMSRLNLEKIDEFMVKLENQGHTQHKTGHGHPKHWSFTVRSKSQPFKVVKKPEEFEVKLLDMDDKVLCDWTNVGEDELFGLLQNACNANVHQANDFVLGFMKKRSDSYYGSDDRKYKVEVNVLK